MQHSDSGVFLLQKEKVSHAATQIRLPLYTIKKTLSQEGIERGRQRAREMFESLKEFLHCPSLLSAAFTSAVANVPRTFHPRIKASLEAMKDNACIVTQSASF